MHFTESSGGGEKLKIRSAYMSKDIGVDDFRPLALVGQGSYAQVRACVCVCVRVLNKYDKFFFCISRAQVYQVQKRDTKQIYAMKILNKRDLVSRNQVTHTRTERKILESIDHPFIVSLRFAFQVRPERVQCAVVCVSVARAHLYTCVRPPHSRLPTTCTWSSTSSAAGRCSSTSDTAASRRRGPSSTLRVRWCACVCCVCVLCVCKPPV
jgi:hypothetical protein